VIDSVERRPSRCPLQSPGMLPACKVQATVIRAARRLGPARSSAAHAERRGIRPRFGERPRHQPLTFPDGGQPQTKASAEPSPCARANLGGRDGVATARLGQTFAPDRTGPNGT
jgi:hypothetical protein